MTIAELLATFLAWCVRHRSDKTVRFYRSRLKLFSAKFGDRPAPSLASLEIDAYLFEAGAFPNGRRKSDSTRHHDAVALTSLQNFALREGLLEKGWFRRLDKPRMGRRERIPTPEEISLLLRGAPWAFRLIYEALSQSGARPGELCKATIGDVDFAKRRIVLLEHKTAAKTGKPRVIAIGAGLAVLLKTAIGERTELAAPVFLSPAGKGWSVENLSGTHRRLRDAAGLPKEIVLYSTRHRFCTELIRAGVPVLDVSQLAGHADIKTTQIYVHRDVTELADAQDRVPGIAGLSATNESERPPPAQSPPAIEPPPGAAAA